MNPEIRQLFTREVLEEALARFGFDPEGARDLGGFESFVQEVIRGSEKLIMKLSHTRRRSVEHVRGEVEFVKLLMARELRVADFLPSAGGVMVEVIPAAVGSFTATLQEFAPGGPARGETWCPELWVQMGAFLGRMHRISRDMREPQPRRADVFEVAETLLVDHLPGNEPQIRARARETMSSLGELPLDGSCRGLIHVDFHRGNFHVDAGGITLFDFDDCMFSWYAHDIAIALFYAVPHDASGARHRADARDFLDHLLEGYCQENSLPVEWIDWIPRFLRLRELSLYASIHRSFEPAEYDRWCQSFMAGRREKIESGIPYLDLDWPGILPRRQDHQVGSGDETT